MWFDHSLAHYCFDFNALVSMYKMFIIAPL